jgi:hypothetical protein
MMTSTDSHPTFAARHNGDMTAVELRAITIPFWALVRFLVKFAFAAIPATIIVSVVISLVGGAIALVVANIISQGAHSFR